MQDDIDAGRVADPGPKGLRNPLQTATLLRSIEEGRFDAVFGGARRDEEKARAKERVFSFRDEFGQWDPKNQRPELWNLYNGRHSQRRAHPGVPAVATGPSSTSGSTSSRSEIELPPIYFAHRRQVFRRDGMLLAVNRYTPLRDGEEAFEAIVRFRTVGDATCTGCVESSAATPEDVVAEVAATRLTERGATRADDRISEAGMEDRKKEGYF